MITAEKNTIELACFEVNEHGRLISGNRRFCRMFGFEESEVQWHYMTDLCRRAQDWIVFRDADVADSICLRMKNRKGRSFNCRLFRNVRQDDAGRIIFQTTVHRVGEVINSLQAVAPQKQTLVFLAKCAHCGDQVRVQTAGETRLRQFCNRCAAQFYPEAFDKARPFL